MTERLRQVRLVNCRWRRGKEREMWARENQKRLRRHHIRAVGARRERRRPVPGAPAGVGNVQMQMWSNNSRQLQGLSHLRRAARRSIGQARTSREGREGQARATTTGSASKTHASDSQARTNGGASGGQARATTDSDSTCSSPSATSEGQTRTNDEASVRQTRFTPDSASTCSSASAISAAHFCTRPQSSAQKGPHDGGGTR